MSYLDRIRASLEPIKGRGFRVSESQEQVATAAIVDSAEEQSRLEELLDESKPPYHDVIDHLHYLLKTPFRYPPLDYGSRFGKTFEKSLFYGAADTKTALAETAFYRFVFIHHVQNSFPKPLKSQHTIFEFSVKTNNGVLLQSPDWQDVREQLVSPADYRFTQAIGSAMREAGVDAFQFVSARAVQADMRALNNLSTASGLRGPAAKCVGINWGLFRPAAFHKAKPFDLRPMIAVTTLEKVSILVIEPDGSSTAVEFPVTHFLVSGRISRPAS